LISFYWTLESERAIRSLLQPVANGQRESTREISGQITERVGGYVHSAHICQARCEERHVIPQTGSRASISKQVRA
jgi:hypothetical protein